MTLEHALALFGFSVAAAGTPGPSNTLLTATGAQVGVVRGLPALVGVAAGMALLMFLVAFGVGNAISQSTVLVIAMKWSGAAVLCWLAWKIATAPADHIADRSQRVGFAAAFGFQWINPKSWLVCTSAAATFLTQNGQSVQLQAATLALVFMLAALPSCFVWLAFGAVLQRALRSERAMRTFNIAMGVLLAASVVVFFI